MSLKQKLAELKHKQDIEALERELVELCKKYPMIKLAADNGYKLESINPLTMYLPE